MGVRAREPQRPHATPLRPQDSNPGLKAPKACVLPLHQGGKDTSRPEPDGEGRDAGTVSHVPVALGTLRGGSARPDRARLRPGRLQERTWH